MHILHRVKEGRDIFFIANQHHDGPAKTFHLRAHAEGIPEFWDAMRNEIRSLPYERTSQSQVDFKLKLEPSESVLVVFRQEDRALPARVRQNIASSNSFEVVRQSVDAVNPYDAMQDEPVSILKDSSWVWHAADPDRISSLSRYFRGIIELPNNKMIQKATMRITAIDNFSLYLNGHEIGGGAGHMNDWRRAVTINLKGLRLGKNFLAIQAKKHGRRPKPTGLIGRFQVIYDDGTELSGSIDASWKSFSEEVTEWTAPQFDDSAWPNVKVLATYGECCRGDFDRKSFIFTKPNVLLADPFYGTFEVPANWINSGKRIYLETSEPPHEASIAVKLNDQFAGGFIGRPFRIDITDKLKQGNNQVLLEPFAPKSVRVVQY